MAENISSSRLPDDVAEAVDKYAAANNMTTSKAICTLISRGLDAEALTAAENAIGRIMRDSISIYMSELLAAIRDIEEDKLDNIEPSLNEATAMSYAVLARMNALSERLGLVENADRALAIDSLAGYDLMRGIDIKTAHMQAEKMLASRKN